MHIGNLLPTRAMLVLPSSRSTLLQRDSRYDEGVMHYYT